MITVEDKNKPNTYCSKCRETKYEKMELAEEDGKKFEIIILRACKCEREAYKREEKQRELQERMEQLKKLKAVSLLGARSKDSSFNKLELDRGEEYIKAVERCKKFCENWEQVKAKGLGIYLYGSVEIGKTMLTACIGNRLLEQGVAVPFTSLLEIARVLKDKYSRNESELIFMKNLEQVDLLTLDDIGTEVIVKSTKEKSWLQEKTVDRIVEMSTVRLELRGTSYHIQNKEQAEKVF